MDHDQWLRSLTLFAYASVVASMIVLDSVARSTDTTADLGGALAPDGARPRRSAHYHRRTGICRDLLISRSRACGPDRLLFAQTESWSGAELQSLCQEAALVSLRRDLLAARVVRSSPPPSSLIAPNVRLC
jgi:hypothetical protein